MMRRVIVESPYAGEVEANVTYARACVRDCVLRGEAPIASHLLFTQPGSCATRCRRSVRSASRRGLRGRLLLTARCSTRIVAGRAACWLRLNARRQKGAHTKFARSLVVQEAA